MYGGMERLDAADMLTAQCTSPKEEERRRGALVRLTTHRHTQL